MCLAEQSYVNNRTREIFEIKYCTRYMSLISESGNMTLSFQTETAIINLKLMYFLLRLLHSGFPYTLSRPTAAKLNQKATGIIFLLFFCNFTRSIYAAYKKRRKNCTRPAAKILKIICGF